MKVIYWPDRDEELPGDCVATIGFFDGVHSGHRRVLYELVSEAEEQEVEAVVMTFDRAPRETVEGRRLRCITSLEHRLKLFAKLGVDAVVVITFTSEIASLSAREFAARVLKDAMSVRKLILGFDGHFGKDRRGGAELCRDMGIPARRVEPVKIEGEVVSSTAIRRAITEGDLMRAAQLLGRPCSVIGVVVHGDSMGTDIGYPTANLDTGDELLPKEGVYAGRAFFEGNIFAAAVSIGRRATVHGSDAEKVVVEVYLLDEKFDLYGEEMEVQFLAFLRDQVNFVRIDDLKAQIERDVERSREILSAGISQT